MESIDTIKYPKILLACPTSEHKSYCQKDWIEHIRQLTYPNLHILIVDNSENINNAKEIMKLLDGCGKKHIVNWKRSETELRQTLVDCCNLIREYVIVNNFDYWFSLESDIFPPLNVIEFLLSYSQSYKKPVISGNYFHFGGNDTMLLQYERHQLIDGNEAQTHKVINNTFLGDIGHHGLKQVYQCGLGCLLVKSSILKRIKFRYDVTEFKEGFHDYFFHADLELNNIHVFTDYQVICEHRNNSRRWEKLKPKGVVI